jgi:hypothetical protein
VPPSDICAGAPPSTTIPWDEGREDVQDDALAHQHHHRNGCVSWLLSTAGWYVLAVKNCYLARCAQLLLCAMSHAARDQPVSSHFRLDGSI